MTILRVAVAPAVVVLLASFLQSEQVLPPVGATQELIAEKDVQCAPADDEDVVSLAGKRAAWRAPVGKKWTVVINGLPAGSPSDEVRSLYFSPDGAHLLHQARSGKQWMLMVDGRPASAPYDDVRGPLFNPATNDPVYAAKRDGRWRLVEGAHESAVTYADLHLPRFSADGRHVAFSAKPEKKWVLIVDGEPHQKQFDDIVTIRFSPDGARVAYVGRRGNEYTVVVDAEEGPPFDIIGGLQFSADGRRFGYAGARVHRGFGSQRATGRIVVDGVVGPEFEGVQIGSVLKTALQGVDKLVVGHLRRLRSDLHGVSGPAFSPDGTHVAYAARTGTESASVVIDGERAGSFPSIMAGPVFGSDGRLAYMAGDLEGRSVIIDGDVAARIPADATDFIDEFLVSPGGRHTVSVSVNGGVYFESGQTSRARRRLYVDGSPHPEHDAHFLGAIQFSPDGAHVIYVVDRASAGGRDRSFVVTDGVSGAGYDAVFTPVRIDPDGQCVRYAARAGRQFYIVRQPMASTGTR